jgi:hypothetical protein
MRRHQSVDSSSDEYEPTDSETEYHSGSETELTDVYDDVDEVDTADKDNDMEDVDDAEVQLDCAIDCVFLLADKIHPPEYYLKQIEEFSESDFTTEDYRDGTTNLLDRIEEQWYQ